MTATESVKGEFWSENFDTDLYKVLPDVRPVLEAFDGIPIYTVGHTTNGRLNHPTCWNSDGGLISYFGFTKHPETFVPAHCYFGRAEVIECTFAEVIRDAWVHGNGGAFKTGTGYRLLFNADRIQWAFRQLMYEVRGWNRQEGWNRSERDVWKARHASKRWVLKTTARFKWFCGDWQMDRIRRD